MSGKNQHLQTTKVLKLTISKTTSRFVSVEVPESTSDDELQKIARLVDEQHYDECVVDSLEVSVQICDEDPEFQAYLRDGEWRVRQIYFDSGPRKYMDDVHAAVIRRQEDRKDIEFNRVTIEFADGTTAPGLIYYQAGHAVVLAFLEDRVEEGVLDFDHCYPVTKETRLLPWEAVSCRCMVFYREPAFRDYDPLVSQDSEQATERNGSVEPAKEPLLLPDWELFKPTPRKVTDRDTPLCRIK